MMADVQCGINYQIKVGSDIILNPFEVREEEEWSEMDGDYMVLKLKDKVEDARSSLMIMVQGNKGAADFELTTYLERVITDIIVELYEERGIIDGQVDSLFEEGLQEKEILGSGKRRKTLPTMTDFYKRL